MPPSHSAPPAANRGLSSRQWKDILRAMKEIRPSVSIVMHGVTISGDGQQQRQPQQPQQKAAEHDASHESMDTDDSLAGTSKKKQRDAQRAKENRVCRRFELLARPLLHAGRRIHRDAVWTAWMRHKTALKKLRGIFWRAWTKPVDPTRRIHEMRMLRCDGLIEDPVLGPTSHRDEFIRSCFYTLCHEEIPAIFAKLKPYPYFSEADGDVDGEGFDTTDMEDAIALSLAESPPARKPSDRQVGKSKSQDAEVRTPASARARSKRSGRR